MPLGAMKFTKQSLKSDGTCLIGDRWQMTILKDNLNLVSKSFYAASTLVCVPNSLADNGTWIRCTAGEKKIKQVAEAAGFTRFKRAIQTPFNIVYEVKI